MIKPVMKCIGIIKSRHRFSLISNLKNQMNFSYKNLGMNK